MVEKNKSVETTKKPNLKYQRDKDREKVKGIFKYYEIPGGSMSFSLKLYKEDPVEKYDMVDGQMYEVPLGVAKHLNRTGWYPVHQYTQDETGKSLMKIGQKVRRYGFQSLEFIDVEDVPTQVSQIITVENV